MRNKKIFFLLSLIVISHINALAQLQDIVQQKFESYLQSHLQEKLYVHTDKSFYLAGEIAWFKIYDVDASFHTPLNISKVAYVELLDFNNKPVLQAKIALNEGAGNGSLYIPVVINSGNYKLRAYSNWMKNYGAEYFFEKSITIINSQKAYDIPVLQKSLRYDIQFFPEGGNLVQDMQSTVGFKAVDQNGKGIACSGVIVAANNDTVASFRTLQFGMGSFVFTPVSGQHYKAVLQPIKAASFIKELPPVYTEGYVMTVNDAGSNQVLVNVQCNIPGINEVYFFAHTRQSVKVAETSRLNNGRATFRVTKDKLGDGVSHFTIFNNSRQPVCERLYFKPPSHNLYVNASTSQSAYGLRKKVTINLNTGGQNKKGMTANLSLAVYRLDSLQTSDESTINSYLWLVSDLGAIESPGYYFNNPEMETAKAMDNLMLTQGWRRFRWEELLKNRTPYFEYPPEYKGHIISGKIIDTRTGRPANDVMGYLSVPGNRSLFSPDLSDSNGRVNFEMRNMFGTSEIIVQTDPREDSLYRVEIANPFSEKYSPVTLPEYVLDKKYLDNVLDQSIGMQVQNIYSGDRMQRFYLQDNDTAAFYRNADWKYLLDDYTRFTTMEEVLREYVVLVNVRRKQGEFHLYTYDEPGKKIFYEDPLVLLDGIPVFDMNKLLKYDPLKLRKLEVLTRKYFLGSSSFDGVLNWSTYKGDFNSFELDPRVTVLDYEGLQLQRQFYAPVYETPQQLGSHLPDFRNQLYWAPELITNKEGNSQVSFYTSDIPGKYLVVAQGITKDGSAGTGQVFFEVK